ncbi:MAG: hypothetical protein AAGH65_07910, partial [Pseudomonadota bacterium]
YERTDDAPRLAALMVEQDLDEGVIKPAVSGAGRETWRVAAHQANDFQPRWQQLLRDEAMLFQPFMPAIIEQGEVSLIVIGGQVMHAVRKVAAAGEFRVQDDHGGTVHSHRPNADEVHIAEQAIAAVNGSVAYARVDLVNGPEGPMIMELELIEPELFFRNEPESAVRLVEQIVQVLKA